MAKNYKKDAQQLLDMADVNQFQRDIANYSADALINLSKIFFAYKIENDREGYDLVLKEKISIIKETRLSKEKSETKTVKSIAKVIAKVQEEAKQEATPPPKSQKPRNSSLSGISIKSSSDTPRNSGVKYNYQKGQGDFFGKSSAFKLIQQLKENNESSSNPNQMGFDFDGKGKKTRKPSANPALVKVSMTHIEAKALKQIKDVLMGSGSGVGMRTPSAKKRTVKRLTKAEKDKIQLKKDELEFKKEHLAELKYKHRLDGRIDRKKLKEAVGANNNKTQQQARTLEFREKVEKNKLERIKLNQHLKEKLAERHIEYSRLAIQKARINRQTNKDKQDARFELQKQRKDQTNRNQMERHLHRIHPALGMLYGMSQNKREAQGNTQGGGLMSSLLGGLAGGVGAAGVGAMGKGIGGFRGMGRNIGANALKIGTSRIPILGAGIAGISEGLDSGSVGKGLATFAGALTGSALLGAAAGAVFGPVGAIVGAIIGNTLGMLAAKDIFNVLNSKNTVEKGTPRNPYRNPPNVEQIKPKGYGRFASLNSPQNAQSASGSIRKAGSEGDDFLSKEEGLNLNAYKDGKTKTGKGLVSIGRGHQIKDHEYAQGYIQAGDERIPISGDKGLGTKLTKEQAEALYKTDSQSYANTARNELGAGIYDKLTEKQKTALTSYAYNVGSIKSLIKHGLKDKLKSGDIQGASDIIKDKGIRTFEGNFNKGLDGRRKKEAQMFLEKAPSKIESLQDSTNRVQQKSMEDKSKPINVVTVGGSTGGSSTNISNTYVNPVNTDSTIRQLAQNIMYPARMV